MRTVFSAGFQKQLFNKLVALMIASASLPALGAGGQGIGSKPQGGGDTALACSLPAPDMSLDPHPDDGIGLDMIVQYEKTTGQGYIASVEPRLFLEFDSGETITNLSETKQKKLVFGDQSKGYQVVDYSSYGIGLGVNGKMEFPNTTFLANSLWVNVGLLPITGRNSMAIRYYRNMDAVENRPDVPSLGQAQEAFARMLPGDVLTYNTHGGIVFWAGFGVSFIGVQTAAMARGDFQIYMEKLNSDLVYVKVSDTHLDSLALQAGALLSSVSTSLYSRYGKAFGFALNMKDPVAVKAYRDLVRGNIAPVQKLALRKESDSVRFWDEAEHIRRGNAQYVNFFSVPFLFKLSWSRDRYFEAVRRKSYECERTLNATYGAYYTQKYLKLAPYEKTTTKAFYGASYSLKDNNERSLARGFFGHMQLSYENFEGTVRALRHGMERMGEETGLGNLLMLDMPEASDRMNNVSLQLRAHMTAQNTKNIVSRGSRDSFNSLRAFTGKMVSDTFATAGAPASLCSQDGQQLDASSCMAVVGATTDLAMDKMRDAAMSLGRALRSKSEKAATQAYARFGEAMLTNAFTFKAGLMLAGNNMKVDYVVSGSDFSTYIATFRTDGSTGRLVKENREPMIRRMGRPSSSNRGRATSSPDLNSFGRVEAPEQEESMGDVIVTE